ncbi:MAG TPA: APC family permease [Solirubrobacteraceae bacterium]
MEMVEGELHHRQTSGLVREGKPSDAIFFNFFGGTLGPVIGWTLLFGIAFYPGSNVLLSVALAFLFCLGLNVTYAYFSAIMPRSGGDYVFISRTFHPWLGFAANASFMFWLTFYIGTAGALIGQLGLSTVFRELGQWTGHANWATWGDWFYTDWGRFLSGLAVIAIVGPLIIVSRRGLRTYFRFQKYVFMVCILTLLLTIVATLLMSRTGFISAFNDYAASFSGKADTHAFILEKGGPHGGFDLEQTLLAVTWPFYMTSFLLMSAYWAGEHRTGLRAHLTGIVGAYVLAFVLTMVSVAVSLQAFGVDFLNALGLADPASYGMGFTPYYVELVGAWTGPVLAIIMAIGLGAWLLPYVPALSIMVTRSMLAWSFDGVMPKWLGDVDPRTSNPVNATLVTYASAIFLLALYAFTPWFTVVTALLGFAVTFFITCVAGIVFPYRRRELFEASQGGTRFAGVPVLSIAGAAGALGIAAIAVILVRDPSSGTNWPANKGQIYGIVAAFVAAALIYFVSTALQRRRGVDIGVAYRALPRE